MGDQHADDRIEAAARVALDALEAKQKADKAAVQAALGDLAVDGPGHDFRVEAWEVARALDARGMLAGTDDRERADRLEAMLNFMAEREVQALELHGDEPELLARRVCRTCHVPQPCPTRQALSHERSAAKETEVARLRAQVGAARELADYLEKLGEYDMDGAERVEQARIIRDVLDRAGEGGGE